MIELKHLKTLQALSQYGSLAATATHLHQTQSALSHQFSDLEHRLGFRLFVRKSQPLRFTPQGEVLLQLAQQVLPLVKMPFEYVMSLGFVRYASRLNAIAAFSG